MKEKKKVSLSTILLVIILVVSIIMGYLLYKSHNEKINVKEDNEKLSNQVNNLETELNKLKETYESSSDELVSKYEMTEELACGILNKYKKENLPDANWYIEEVELIAHGDNNTYWVVYTDYNLDGYEESAGTIIEYKDGKWTTTLPGFTGVNADELDKQYNFVMY